MPKKGQYKRNAKPRSVRQRKYNSRPEQKKNRQRRNRDRARMIKKKGKAAVAGKDVHHSGKGATGKTSIKSVKANRSAGGRIGGKAGKGKRKTKKKKR